MKKKMLALLLTLCMVFSLLPVQNVVAEGTTEQEAATHTANIVDEVGGDPFSVEWIIEGPYDCAIVGKSGTFQVMAADGSEITSTLTWTSSDSMIASVTQDVDNPCIAYVEFLMVDTVTISVSDENGNHAECTFTINPQPDDHPNSGDDEEPPMGEEPPSEEVDPVKWYIEASFDEAREGQSGKLFLTAENGDIGDTTVIWTTSEDIFASVNADVDNQCIAHVNFHREGTVTISASDDSGSYAEYTFTVLPAADEEEPGEEPEDGFDDESHHAWTQIPEEGVSGKCSDSASWSLTADGTLTISGTGSTGSYEYVYYGSDGYGDILASTSPWATYGDNITSVVVEEGITRIGEFTFFGMRMVTSVTLPSTLTEIAPHSLQTMRSLEEISLPDKVKSIGNYALYNVPLKSITIPAGLQQLGAYAFHVADSLYIDNVAHWLTIERIPDEYGEYTTFHSQDTKVYFDGKLATDLVIPEGVTSIAPYAFGNVTTLTSISIPDTVTFIGFGAF